MRAEVALGEGNGEGGVGGKIECGVAFAPVSVWCQEDVGMGRGWGMGDILDHGDVHRRCGTGAVDLGVGH